VEDAVGALVQFLVILVFFGGMIGQAISKARKTMRKDQAEQPWSQPAVEIEEVEQPEPPEEEWVPQRDRRPSPRPRPSTLEPTDLEDLQRQLKEVFGDAAESESQTAPRPVAAETRRKSAPESRGAAAHREDRSKRGRTRDRAADSDSPFRRWKSSLSRERKAQEAPRPEGPPSRKASGKKPRREQVQDIPPPPRPAAPRSVPVLYKARGRSAGKGGRRFPNLHPDPTMNAILLGEILRPYSQERFSSQPGPDA